MTAVHRMDLHAQESERPYREPTFARAVECRALKIALLVTLDSASVLTARLAQLTDSPPQVMVEAADAIEASRTLVADCLNLNAADGA
jgi:hypothetical protein